MYLQYGNVILKVIDLLRYDREGIYTPDKTELLHVRHTIGVSCTYAPGGDPAMPSVVQLSPDTAAVLNGNDRTAVVVSQNLRALNPGQTAEVFADPRLETDDGTITTLSTAGGLAYGTAPVRQHHTGPQTDAELRYRLMIPRQKLILWAYDRQTGDPIRWLESPRTGMTTDATFGPLPIGNPVVSAAGEPNSIGVYFEVQTEMLPCATGSDRMVLSHRWQTSHSGDDNNYLTRIIRGEIIFNGEYVHTFGINPDDYRNQFIHPIPVGFVRKVPEVSQSTDGLTIRYTITDTDPTIVFDAGDSGATQLSIMEKVLYNVPRSTNGPGGASDAARAGGTPGERGAWLLQRAVDPWDIYGTLTGRN